jgi:hypothetical protein
MTMPFADAKYPPSSVRRAPNFRDRIAHVVQLTNGERLYVEEHDGLNIAVCVRGTDDYDLWVCRIASEGVMAHTWSDGACERLSRRADG